jgi:hypothetical protein
MGRGIGPSGGNLTLAGGGSVFGPSSSESKNASASLTRLISYVSGRETLVFGSKSDCCYNTTDTPPYGGDLPKVIPRGRWGKLFTCDNSSLAIAKAEQPAQASESGPKAPSAERRREAGGRPSERHEGGPDGDDRDDPAGRSRGGRGAGTEYPAKAAPERTDGWDSPPGRFGIYHDLDAGEGQHHE